MDKKVLSRDGTPLAYECHGDGPAVVLVGGALCTGATLEPLARALSDRFGAVTYDRRGRGASGDTASSWTVAREVEDIAALIEACGGTASLYGVSSGGALALRAAASGLPVDAVAVYETPFALHEERGKERREYTERLTELLGQDRRGDALELFMALTGMPPETVAGARRSPGWAGLEAIAPTLAYDDAVMGDGLLPRELPASLPMPVLAVAGGASPAWMREAARAVADAAPEGTYRVLAGQTHNVDTAALAPLLGEFFGSRGGSGGTR
ncbi:alpha/beta fold hydrolase [Streptomyces sp. NBC_01571]|uniref:alpha/beta fold hydrolase n=1 Tax=unclassified Streptomyces TaxID=2593676 RepID=UPI00225B5FC8|nr:alpha/beta fold hydrolase [Streptomyces sp. NBC_01571]MCX4577672.1 alpha/beta fold hydrolase [Streptomyces sp. NBC_01571]